MLRSALASTASAANTAGKLLRSRSVATLVPAQRVAGAGTDVWTLFNQATAKYGAVNLGQGFMNFPARDFVKEAARAAVLTDANNQYSPTRGRPRLRQALAAFYSPIFGRPLDADSEIIVTAGGNEGILSILAAYINPGDEVLLMEPAFDQYMPNITMMGGVPVFCPLRVRAGVDPSAGNVSASTDWVLDLDEYERCITPRTRVLIVNTPHNPLGKVFTRDELAAIGDIAKRHNLLVLSDEVYDQLVYPGSTHTQIATLPGMWERTITVGSAGKTFGVTGWRVGWQIGPRELIEPSLTAHTRIVFCVNSPLQEAVASAFEQAPGRRFFETQRAEYLARRDKLSAALSGAGLPHTVPDGSYFILVNGARIQIPRDCDFPAEVAARGHSFKLTYFFTKQLGVSGIPPTEFYSDAHRHLAENYVRLAFCKTDDVLDEAARRLERVRTYLA
ncbi:PLP-dependent transferase [Ramicandelaber brevisporus]|nr:PLP-dependent transferase [Ramicandelaber brevisporus]